MKMLTCDTHRCLNPHGCGSQPLPRVVCLFDSADVAAADCRALSCRVALGARPEETHTHARQFVRLDWFLVAVLVRPEPVLAKHQRYRDDKKNEWQRTRTLEAFLAPAIVVPHRDPLPTRHIDAVVLHTPAARGAEALVPERARSQPIYISIQVLSTFHMFVPSLSW
jgi:hypothetical protein